MTEPSPQAAVEAGWTDYLAEASDAQGVVGTLKVLKQLYSPQLDNHRDIVVYLPPSYAEGERRYPVLYMHDGQNLFDATTSFSGEWEVDQTLEDVGRHGIETIVVGIPNMGGDRLAEYSPFEDPKHGGGRGDAYVDFVVQTLKPIVDRDFRTVAERAGTGIAGSSMGGLITLYAFFREPEVFGFAGVMSPALWFADRAILEYVPQVPFVGGKLYLDIGTEEGAETVHQVRRLHDLLLEKGYQKGRDLAFVVENGGRHEEAAWARRLRKQLTLWLDTAPASPDAPPG